MSTGDLLVGALIGAGLTIVVLGLSKKKKEKFAPEYNNYGIANMGFDTDETSIVGSNFNASGDKKRSGNFYK
jgi:hypothetical protein